MTTIKEKIFNSFLERIPELPQISLIILTFALLLPETARKFIDILITKTLSLLPEPLNNIILKIDFSHEEIVTLYHSLLVLLTLAIFFTNIEDILNGSKILSITHKTVGIFMLVTYFSLFILIYDILYDPKINPFFSPKNASEAFIMLSFGLFACFHTMRLTDNIYEFYSNLWNKSIILWGIFLTIGLFIFHLFYIRLYPL